MKKVIVTILFLMGSLFANTIIATNDFVTKDGANFSKELANSGKIAYKEGFLTSKECLSQGLFKDCNLDSYNRSEMVLFVHDENRHYTFQMEDTMKVAIYDNAINTNKVKLFGNIDAKRGIIAISGLSVAVPPKAEFFKGCL